MFKRDEARFQAAKMGSSLSPPERRKSAIPQNLILLKKATSRNHPMHRFLAPAGRAISPKRNSREVEGLTSGLIRDLL